MSIDPPLVAPTDLYSPRYMASIGLWRFGDWQFKVYAIQAARPAPETDLLDDILVMQAQNYVAAQIGRLEATPHYHLGFIILHQWDSSEKWLLIHWWTDGCICRQILAGSQGEQTADFTAVDPTLMACAYELIPIDYERRLWSDTALSGRPFDHYLASSMPEGFY